MHIDPHVERPVICCRAFSRPPTPRPPSGYGGDEGPRRRAKDVPAACVTGERLFPRNDRAASVGRPAATGYGLV
jgi:hypothetical protein